MPDKLIRDYAPITSPADADVVLADDSTRYGTITLAQLSDRAADAIASLGVVAPTASDDIVIRDASEGELARAGIGGIGDVLVAQGPAATLAAVEWAVASDGSSQSRLLRRHIAAPRVVTVATSRALTATDSGALIVVDGGGSAVDLSSPGAGLGEPWSVEIMASDAADAVTVTPASGSLYVAGSGLQVTPITVAPQASVVCTHIGGGVVYVRGAIA